MVRFFTPPRRADARKALLPLMLALGGCAAVPSAPTASAPLAPGAIAAAQSLPGNAATPWPDERWWDGLGDAQLSALIDEGLAHSPDIAMAAARLRKAAAMADSAGGALLPTLDAQASAGVARQSVNLGYPPQFVSFIPHGWNDRGQVNAVFGFDPDLWGKNRALLAAATSEARAAEVEQHAARLALSAGIASAWVDYAGLLAAQDVRQATLDNRLASQRLVSQRLTNGLETRGSLRLAEAQTAMARSELAGAQQAVALRRNQIAALLGAGPDRGLTLAAPTLAPLGTRELPADVTTGLVARRPDVVAALARTEAAAARIRAAHADFYPAIRIDALFGVQALGLGQLFDGGSTFGSVGPAVSLPLFHGGALKARYRGAGADYDEAVADYDRTVIAAYQQVADAVTSRTQLVRRRSDAAAALAASDDALGVARRRYQGGLSSYLDVLAVKDRALQARLALAALDTGTRSADIALIRALGGGYAAPSAPERNPAP